MSSTRWSFGEAELPMKNNQPRRVLMTGASTGIGRAGALHLCAKGFHVFAGVRKESDADALRQRATGVLSSGVLTPLMLDVTDEASIRAAYEIVAAQGGLAGLVNNAGIARLGPLEYFPIPEVRLHMEVNVIGAVAVTQAFLPLLREGKGRVVNISSVSGLCALPFASAYSASKFALEAASDALRVELRPWKIPVSIIEPGNVKTPIWEKGIAAADAMLKSAPPDVVAQGTKLYGPVTEFLKQRARNPRGITPECVARVIEHALTSKKPRARYIVGGDARALQLLRVLPTPLRDWIIETQLPRYGR
jgi:NAD(P)-dependent dehydrogenase (short-subunit alcohol dehydrogenase family)